jgi:hypothetical protein
MGLGMVRAQEDCAAGRGRRVKPATTVRRIQTVRDDLDLATAHEAPQVQPLLATLDKQLKGWAKGDSADHAALRPEIEKNIKRIEKAQALQTAEKHLTHGGEG